VGVDFFASKTASTLAGFFSTMNTRCLRHQPEGPLVLGQEEARGPLRVQRHPHAVASGNDTASTELAKIVLPSLSLNQAAILKKCDG
jgi:hypothetical protein